MTTNDMLLTLGRKLEDARQRVDSSIPRLVLSCCPDRHESGRFRVGWEMPHVTARGKPTTIRLWVIRDATFENVLDYLESLNSLN